MADERLGGAGRATEAAAIEFQRDCAAALRTLSAARGVFTLLLVLGVLTHLAVFIAVYQFDALDWQAANAAGFTPLVGAPSDMGMTATDVIARALPLARLVACLSAGLLLIVFLLTAHTCLAARVPGAAASLAAGMWMVLVLVLLAPWREWAYESWGWTAFFNLNELQQLTVAPAGTEPEHWVLYLQHVGYPLIVLATTAVACLRFSAGYAAARRQILTRTDLRTL
jgi:hypothetical protein